MADKLEIGLLNDYYGGLLNAHQSELMRMYYDCDMSLSEISEVLGITKQGAREVIMRSVSKLTDYEKKLGLVKKISEAAAYLEEMIDFADADTKEKLTELLKRIKEI